MNVNELFEKCLASKHRSRKTITGSTVLKFSKSPFIVWCDNFAPKEARDPESKYMRLLFERGIQHEKDVRKKLYADSVAVTTASFESGFEEVLEECSKGTQTLTGAPLFYLSEDLYGILDVLEKDDSHSSIFGNYHYVIKEIKSAKNIRRDYVMQAAFYNYVLGKIQGYTPKKFYLINREKEEFAYDYEAYRDDLMKTLEGIREIFKGKEITPTAKACRWPWESYCNRRAIEEDDVSVIPHIGGVLKKQLNGIGIFTVKDLHTKPVDIDIPPGMIQKIKNYAKAWVEKKPIIIQKPDLVESQIELYIDFEGTDEFETEEGMVKVDYLIGVLVKDGSEVYYEAFVSDDLTKENNMFNDFMEFMKKFPNVPIYHYGPHEKIHMGQLGSKYKVDVSNILKNMVDILAFVRKCVALPIMSMSLKEVAKYLDFSWRGDVDAQDSMVLFLEFLNTGNKDLLNKIIDYNEDDVRATQIVKEFLASLAQE